VIFGKRIGKAVTEIQPGGVAVLAEVEKCLAREMRLLHCERFEDDPGSAKKDIALTASIRPTIESSRKFAVLIRQSVGGVNELGEESGFGFPKQDGGERGGIQDHFGRLRSS